MNTSLPINRGRDRSKNLTSSPPKQPPQPQPPPTIPGKEKKDEKEEDEEVPPDMNKSNPRLLVNRESIYERQLPGDAYITVYVQRLQHGYYSSTAVSDTEAEHVDFLALSFVFHSPHTLSHRFKSATIRTSIQGTDQLATDATSSPKCRPNRNPRILMHAPHLIYGTVSPETMEWTFSLAGSIGISETPLSANLIPSGSVNSRYRRYEMMRIQGSARTLKSPRGPQFDIEAGEVVWSLEENNLQRSGLPREFTFVMLIQKPSSKSRIKLSLEIDPVIQSWWGNYPNWSLNLPSYRPVKRRDVDFNKEVGQRFEPLDTERGFNFAALVSRFDDYIALPGRKFSRRIEIPKEADLPERQGYPQSYPGQYGSINPMQGAQQGTQGTQSQGMQGILNIEQKYQLNNPQPFAFSSPTNMPSIGIETQPNNLNLSLGPTHGVAIMNLSALRSAMVSPRARGNEMCSTTTATATTSSTATTTAATSTTLTKRTSVDDDDDNDDGTGTGTGPGEWPWPWPYPPETGPGVEIETIRSRMLRTVHWTSAAENGGSENDGSESRESRVMNMENRPLTPSCLLLEEGGEGTTHTQ